MSSITAGTTSTTTLVHSGDTTGSLVFKTNDTGSGGTTAVTLDTSQNATFAGKVTSAGALTLASNGTTTAVTIDTSQNVGIGTSSPTATLETYIGAGPTTFGGFANSVRINGGNNSGKYVSLTFGGYGSNAPAAISYAVTTGTGNTSGDLIFGTRSVTTDTLPTERMRIDSSGNLCINSTSVVGAEKLGVKFDGSTINGIGVQTTASSSGDGFVIFRNSAGTAIGTISRVGTTNAVAYNTTSDQRLKSNIENAKPVLDKLMQVQVRQYDWTEGSTHQDYGFIAQELEPTLSGVVTRGKTEEDMWQLDYAKLTPHLVKAIQELKAINDQQAETINAQSEAIASLTARVVALEGK